MLYYFLQVNLYMGLLYGIYLLLLCNSSSHNWRRYCLLVITLLPLVLPALHISSFSRTTPTAMRAAQLKELLVTGNAIPLSRSSDWLTGTCIAIACLLLLRLVLQYGRVIHFLSRYETVQINGIRTVLNCNAGPGSFFHTVLLPGNHADPALFRHEAAHIRFGHHYDRLFLNILLCLLFPVLPLYLIRKELELVHEFQADAAACNDRDAYTELLLNQHFRTRQFSAMQHFFQHPLKQRIMMLQHVHPIRSTGKCLLLLAASLTTGSIILLQSCTQKEPARITTVVRPSKEVFKEVAHKPEFKGGDPELMRFLGDNIQYPAHEQELHIEGTVLARFVVDETGKIKDIEIVRKVSPALDQEVIRVIKAMPDWVPGRNEKGEAVCVYFQLPVTFKTFKQNDPSVVFTAIPGKAGNSNNSTK